LRQSAVILTLPSSHPYGLIQDTVSARRISLISNAGGAKFDIQVTRQYTLNYPIATACSESLDEHARGGSCLSGGDVRSERIPPRWEIDLSG
jgi:hypothetical protein